MSEVDHRHLRSALEFAVLIATEGQKRRPPLNFPKELKPFLGKPRLPTGSLGRIRRIIESDDVFRGAISVGAMPELVDDVGRLWLAGQSGWEQQAAEILEGQSAEAESKDLERDLKRAEKRRVAAEQAAARIQAEVLVRDQTIAMHSMELDDLRADVTKANEALAEVRTELIDTRNELRHARDREAAAIRRADAMEDDARALRGSIPSDGQQPAGQVAAAEESLRATARVQRRLDDALAASRDFASEMERLLIADSESQAERAPATSDRRAAGRTPLALPGGVISTSAQAAEHLVRADAAIIIDGYNVAKLGWPGRSLEEQRDALVNRTENLARRHGADVTIVFDGDSVVGAHAERRRTVRVVFSPVGVIADDVIRNEVACLPLDRAVVVVTNDREIVDDVRRAGANVVPSNAFIATL